jgi:hypothetical protein
MGRVPPEQLRLEVEHLEPPKRDRGEHATPRKGARKAERATPAADPGHRVATQLLETAGALLTRSHLRELGLERRAVDAVFRALPVVALPGYSRPMIRAEDYLELLEHHTFRGDRVRPTRAA